MINICDLRILRGQFLSPINKINRMMRFLTNNGLNIIEQLPVQQAVPVGTHNPHQKSLKMGNMHPKSIDEHCKVRAALTPDRVATFYRSQFESKLTNRDFIHRVGSHVRILAGMVCVHQIKAPSNSRDICGSVPSLKPVVDSMDTNAACCPIQNR